MRMELEPEETRDDKLRRQREARRKKILENAQSRLEKLRGVQESPRLKAQREQEAPEPVSATVVIDAPTKATADAATADPPDEVIERQFYSAQAQPLPSRSLSSARVFWLVGAIGAVRSDYGYNLRTAAALVCVLVVTLLNFVFGEYLVSYVISMFILDCTLTLWLGWRPKAQPANPNPLGWLSVAMVPLSFFHPILPQLFETACLCVLLLSVFVRDALFVVFCSVISVALVQIVSK